MNMVKTLKENIDYWTTHSLEKVFPESKMPTYASKSIKLKGAGNETEDAQICIRLNGNINPVEVSFSFTDLVGKKGKIDAENMNGYWEWYVKVMKNPWMNILPWSRLKKAPAFFPDACLERKEVVVKRNWTQTLWLTIYIPSGTPAGRYTGIITLKCKYNGADQSHGEGRPLKKEEEIVVPITLDVWSFSLPSENTLHHTEWFYPDFLARSFRVNKWSEEHWALIKKVAEDMVKHHQNMIMTSFLVLVVVKKKEDGQYIYDFSRLDHWIDIFRKAGIKWIEGGFVAKRCAGWRSDFVFRRISLRDLQGKGIDDFSKKRMSEEEFIPHMEKFLKAVYSHLEEKYGLEYCIQHIADEPINANKESWVRISRLVKSWIPKEVKIIDAALSKKLGDLIDIRVPQIHHIKASEREEGSNLEKNLWSYVCMAPQGLHPNRFIDYKSIRNRIIFWISYSLKLEGFLHWGYNWWGSRNTSPWKDSTAGTLSRKIKSLPASDPFIVYPGQEIICSSIRWEVIRKGFEDHKLLSMLDKAAKNDGGKTKSGRRANEIIEMIRRKIAKSSRKYTKNSQELLSLREEIGDLLSKMLS